MPRRRSCKRRSRSRTCCSLSTPSRRRRRPRDRERRRRRECWPSSGAGLREREPARLSAPTAKATTAPSAVYSTRSHAMCQGSPVPPKIRMMAAVIPAAVKAVCMAVRSPNRLASRNSTRPAPTGPLPKHQEHERGRDRAAGRSNHAIQSRLPRCAQVCLSHDQCGEDGPVALVQVKPGVDGISDGAGEAGLDSLLESGDSRDQKEGAEGGDVCAICRGRFADAMRGLYAACR